VLKIGKTGFACDVFEDDRGPIDESTRRDHAIARVAHGIENTARGHASTLVCLGSGLRIGFSYRRLRRRNAAKTSREQADKAEMSEATNRIAAWAASQTGGMPRPRGNLHQAVAKIRL
jgi:hypothetical protein